MKVKIGDIIYDSEVEPIVLIFENDKVRLQVANHLTNMEPKESIRIYAQYPKGSDIKVIDQFIDSAFSDKEEN